jgi:uncharacterized OB-fold protein
MLENQEYIKENGLKKFVKKEDMKWKCDDCGKLICVHRKCCLNCKNKNNE